MMNNSKNMDVERKPLNPHRAILRIVRKERRVREMKKEQTTIRLTIRAPEELEKRIRGEAARRGMSINQTMLSMLHRYFMNQED